MNKERIPFAEGLFIEDADGGALLASRCRSCGKAFFPRRANCPGCFGTDMEDMTLRNTAKLYTFTISRMPAFKYEAPFALGWVEFPEGVRVVAQIKGWENKPLKIGMDMKLIIDKLWGEEEREVIGYKFEPVIGGGQA